LVKEYCNGQDSRLNLKNFHTMKDWPSWLQEKNYQSLNPSVYADSRMRPLALLRLMILLPCLVDIRLRKPWFRARFIRLGWNVRFIFNLPYLLA
jgi:hypothetical protein